VTSAFAVRADAGSTVLVTGLPVGQNVLRAKLPNGPGAKITITNHPIGGPVFSGTQVQPWTCNTTSNPSLGPALDAQCNAATQYRYMYRTTTGQFVTYDPKRARAGEPRHDDDRPGITVPYIVRIERGTMNPRDPRNCGPVRSDQAVDAVGAPAAVESQAVHALRRRNEPGVRAAHANVGAHNEALSRGFAVANSSMLINSCNANFVTAAETTMMLRSTSSRPTARSATR